MKVNIANHVEFSRIKIMFTPELQRDSISEYINKLLYNVENIILSVNLSQ